MILAIETSCDETSAAIVSGGKILSNTLFSQVKKHRKYGGVVPELASRIHADVIDKIIQQAIQDAGVTFTDLSHIAVTSGPGLEGALMVGIAAAQTLANLLYIPLIPVNHLHGHIYAAEVSGELKFPLVVCLASGGHTQLIYMKEDLSFEIIANTMDDACGESFDKVARMLDLPYPGGPHIERLAKDGQPIVKLPHPIKNKSEAFSFSGLKTAVLQLVQSDHDHSNADIAASFQDTVAQIMATKLMLARQSYNIQQVILCGGVFANQHIRSVIASQLTDIDCIVPTLDLCTDNAAMIGLAAYHYLTRFSGVSELVRCNTRMGITFPKELK